MIYLDTCIVIYALEGSPPVAAGVRAALGERPDEQFAISPLVTTECLVDPIKAGNEMKRAAYMRYLNAFAMLPLTEESAVRAAELRARFGLRTPSALHVAIALTGGCSAIWTSDHRLARAVGEFAVVIPAQRPT